MSAVYACDQTALLKILLHSAKYPAASVNGILLGKTNSNKLSVEVVDAIPLLHSFLTLAPALETALVQVIHAGNKARSCQSTHMVNLCIYLKVPVVTGFLLCQTTGP